MPFYPFRRNHFAVCEFTESFVRVLIGRPGKDERLETLGFSEVPGDGVGGGRFRNLSDAAECIAGAAAEAAAQSGIHPDRLVLNLDDPFLEEARVRGSSFLEKGQEGFRSRHVQEALRRALQSVNPSEKHLVYKGLAQILIDGIEYSADPVGIFGKELVAVLHLLLSESREAQNLRSVVERAGMGLEGIFPSAFAALHGLLGPGEMKGARTLVLANPKVCHAARAVNGALVAHRSFLLPAGYGDAEIAAIMEWAGRVQAGEAELLVAGEESSNEALLSKISSATGAPVRRLAARLDGPLAESRYAVIAGLAWLGRSIRPPASRGMDGRLLQKIRMRARSFAQEYF